MIKDIFGIDKFNVYEDAENYYFFRSLEEVDTEAIKNKTITNENGEIVRLITDREFYGETKYSKDDSLSLEQIVEHIKMHYNKHTNCISFSSNANVVLDYGRNTYNDRYVMLKVPKNKFGSNVVNAGQYILEEVSKALDEYYLSLTSEEDGSTKYYFDYIDNARSNEKLEEIKQIIMGKRNNYEEDIFEDGIEKLTDSQDYRALNNTQNLLKNKIVLKLNLLKKPIIENISNDFLITIVGGAFSSVEVIHYNDVDGNLKEISPEILDVLSLIQQIPETFEVKTLKQELIAKINNGTFKTTDFDIDRYDIKSFEESLTLEKIYSLTRGHITYHEATNIYKKAYSLAKARLRKEKSIQLLKSIIDTDKYKAVIESLAENTYGIEYDITNRVSNSNSINISESVNLKISDKERFILEYIEKQDNSKIEEILDNPISELQDLVEENYTDNYIEMNWFANSIIDLIDWDYYGIVDNLSAGQRKLLIDSLLANNFLEKYHNLKGKNLSDKEIANAILLQLIRKTDDIDITEKFSLGELEEFLGCNKIKNTGINLKPYQREAVTNINQTYINYDYTAVVLPTGTGKSYVGIVEMHYFEEKIKKLENGRHAKILYLAPNNYILDQLKRIIVENYRKNFTDSDEEVIKKTFPNLTLCTYQYLNGGKEAERFINDKYDLIIFDELHRTGAEQWGKQIDRLLENQPAKILGITATPERDVDEKDMTEMFAKRYGYTDDDILLEKHLSYNMNLIEAIERGIIHNPNVINCEYSLLKDGSLEGLECRIDDILDENIKSEAKKEYEKLRSQISNADGIEKILHDNLKSDGKYIIFIPLSRKKDGTYINTESEEEITETQAQTMIRQYQNLMNQFLFSGEYLEKNKEQLSSIYRKINDNVVLTDEEVEFLETEKDNILLLVKLHINSLPNELQTLSNDMAIKISEYMNWDLLDDSKIAAILKKKMKDEVNSYNMISDNSKRQNDVALSNFNSDNSSKKKFMFVMDMLNEGVHVERIDGIIWFRTLSRDSKILYSQQLGRCISAINEDNKDNVPTIIDLVNNTLKVDILKGTAKEKEDLKTIISITRWIENNKIPDISSNIKEEQNNALTIRRLQRKYSKYLDKEKLESIKLEKKIIIEKILEVGSKYDLWNYEYIIDNPNHNTGYDRKSLLGIFSITGVLRKFADISEYVDENSSFGPKQYVDAIEAYCMTYQEWPKHKEKGKSANGKTGDQLVSWLTNSGYSRDEFRFGEELKRRLDELKSKYYEADFTTEQYVDAIEAYCMTYQEWPKQGEKGKSANGKTGGQLASWLGTTAGYNKGEFKYGEELKRRLDELKSKYYEADFTTEQYVETIEAYCMTYQEWPKQREKEKKAKGKTGEQLAQWLIRSGYSRDEFKFGEELKRRLDELKSKYYEADFTIEQYVETIEAYCMTYQEWPKQRVKDKSINGKTGEQLVRWLTNSGYSRDEFRFGEELKRRLDELKSKYYEAGFTTEQYVDAIEAYCMTYQEWPKQGEKGKSANGKTGDQLTNWLGITAGYNKGEFKYEEELKRRLDELKSKYYEADFKTEQYVDAIEAYCMTYQEWPKHKEKGKSANGKTGDQLASWLGITAGYNKGEFKYGEELKRRLDELKSKYYEANFTTEQYVDAIEAYCMTYQEWPKQREKGKSANGKTGEQLARWLGATAGYNKGEFKYGEELKRRLDELKAEYYKAKKKFDEAKKDFDKVRHDKVVEKIINYSKENSNEQQIRRAN